MRPRASFLALAVSAGLVAAVALPGTAAAVPRDPGAPGCILQGIGADHRAGTVVWQIACDERRWVTVDATAFSGTPDDHVVVDEQRAARWVEPGDTWVDVLTVETAGVDQIRAQATTKTAPSDSTEPPAIIGGTTG